MTPWLWLTPLLVLAIVLLFRFLGCTSFGGTDAPSPGPAAPAKPRYRDYIMGAANNPGTVKNPESQFLPNAKDVIAYWRLLDAVATDGADAADEKSFVTGKYHQGQSIAPRAQTSSSDGSEAAPGTIIAGQKSLIDGETKTGLNFNGGFVAIPFKDGLYTNTFTIEAWVLRQGGPGAGAGAEHALFAAGGHYLDPYAPVPNPTADYHGFSLVMNGANRWQARFASTFLEVFPSPPLATMNARSYVALTVDSIDPATGGQKATLYLDGKAVGLGEVFGYSMAGGAPLLIAVNNSNLDPTSAIDPIIPMNPILGQVQEVVLYRRALSVEEIENRHYINS